MSFMKNVTLDSYPPRRPGRDPFDADPAALDDCEFPSAAPPAYAAAGVPLSEW